MASIVLETLNPQERVADELSAPAEEEAAPVGPAEEEAGPLVEPPAPAEAEQTSPQNEQVITPVEVAERFVPAPKLRGRPPRAEAECKAPGMPKAKPAPKPEPKPKPRARKAPPPESDDSFTDVENTLRNVYRHVAKPDMETAILEFLVNRKQSEQTRRRKLWSQLAKF